VFSLIKRRLALHRTKSNYKEYGTELREFNLPAYGTVKYAQWLNPCEGLKDISESRIGFFSTFVHTGDFAIDVGAHTGDTTIPLALAVGKQGTVLALEPSPVVYKILFQNANLNQDKTNIIPLCAAATQYDGEFFYNSSEPTFNNGGISERVSSRHGKYALPEKVQGIHLGNYLRANYQNKLSRFSFIKIDTEGGDYDVMLSLSGIINEIHPIIVAECFRKWRNRIRYRLFDYLVSCNYSVYHVSDFTSAGVFTQLSRTDMAKWRHYDFCALPHGKSPINKKSP
jgi:FkbM family methyltransferase